MGNIIKCQLAVKLTFTWWNSGASGKQPISNRLRVKIGELFFGQRANQVGLKSFIKADELFMSLAVAVFHFDGNDFIS